MRGKITKEILDKMVELRKGGATYKAIEAEFNISRQTCIHYLRNLKIDESISATIWKQAEQKAIGVLSERGFTNIVDLNEISPNGYFDILAKKGNDKWLFDVTINESKDLAAKSARLVNGFRCGILYFTHDLNEHRIVELVEVR